jgi:hypothetical protein
MGEHAGKIAARKLMSLHMHNDAVAMLLDGKSTTEIVKYIQHKYDQKNKQTVLVLVTEVKAAIKERAGFEVENMVLMHLARYEEIYTQCMNMRLLGMAQQALKAKEKLLGFHREGFHMRVSQGQMTQIQMRHVGNEFDLKKLQPERRERLTYFLQKASSNPPQ